MSVGPVLCIGAAHWDAIGFAPERVRRGDDLPGRVRRVPGGVALNLALWLRREGLAVELITALGADAAGRELLALAEGAGIGCGGVVRRPGQQTGCYVAIEDASGLVAAVADTAALVAAGRALLGPLRAAAWVELAVVDGNLDADVLAGAAAALAGVTLCVAGASPAKAGRLRAVLGHPALVLYLNRAEAGALCGTAFADSRHAAEGVRNLGAMAALVTDGAGAAAWADASGVVEAAPPPLRCAPRVTGAGDRLMAAHIAARLRGAAPGVALSQALACTAEYLGQGEPA